MLLRMGFTCCGKMGLGCSLFMPLHPLYHVVQWPGMWIEEENSSSSCTQSPRVEVPCC
jgi:hypothetical protein